jgi:hypothetical protein
MKQTLYDTLGVKKPIPNKIKIYIIREAEFDSLENDSDNAFNYNKIIGFVKTLEEAQSLCNNSKEILDSDCWAVQYKRNKAEILRKLKYQEVNEL